MHLCEPWRATGPTRSRTLVFSRSSVMRYGGVLTVGAVCLCVVGLTLTSVASPPCLIDDWLASSCFVSRPLPTLLCLPHCYRSPFMSLMCLLQEMNDALRDMEAQVGKLSKVVVKAKAEYDNKVDAIQEEEAAQKAHETQIEEVSVLVSLEMQAGGGEGPQTIFECMLPLQV